MAGKIPARERALSRVQLYKRVFGTIQGQQLLLDMMDAHFMMRSLPKDPVEMARAEGERTVLLRIIKFTQMDAAKLIERIAEYENQVT